MTQEEELFPVQLEENGEESPKYSARRFRPYSQEDINATWELGQLLMQRINFLKMHRNDVYSRLNISKGYFEALVENPTANTRVRLSVILHMADVLNIPMIEILLLFWPEDTFMQERIPLLAMLSQFLEMDEATKTTALTVMQALFKQGGKVELTEEQRTTRDRLLVYPDTYTYARPEKWRYNENEE